MVNVWAFGCFALTPSRPKRTMLQWDLVRLSNLQWKSRKFSRLNGGNCTTLATGALQNCEQRWKYSAGQATLVQAHLSSLRAEMLTLLFPATYAAWSSGHFQHSYSLLFQISSAVGHSHVSPGLRRCNSLGFRQQYQSLALLDNKYNTVTEACSQIKLAVAGF